MPFSSLGKPQEPIKMMHVRLLRTIGRAPWRHWSSYTLYGKRNRPSYWYSYIFFILPFAESLCLALRKQENPLKIIMFEFLCTIGEASWRLLIVIHLLWKTDILTPCFILPYAKCLCLSFRPLKWWSMFEFLCTIGGAPWRLLIFIHFLWKTQHN